MSSPAARNRGPKGLHERGRRAQNQLGYLAVIAFYLALWLFGWIEAAWVLVMLPAMLLLLREELRATPAAPIEEKLTADVSS
jgi:hypothetical protein